MGNENNEIPYIDPREIPKSFVEMQQRNITMSFPVQFGPYLDYPELIDLFFYLKQEGITVSELIECHKKYKNEKIN